ncbi:hypothetical protein [Actinacidiphila glaucinigra]|uniref:Uncharacterized protein n=1 Tax=Actinacidiphila glaucinigra TaxID=235986 RepID=A0A239NK51_9ACTN|nr:hypothetical protein [Actinacidiphila glaucinigra]SNT55256.1 hypothetical protein SAMN05216252_13917 [Actinacidiphila glaucinigra]
MQYIEVTELAGVRSAIIRFRSRGTALVFELYPMIHLAEPAFYEEVTARLRASCDLVIAEGVRGSTATRALTRSYRSLGGHERLGLVVQDIDFDTLGVPVICPDMSGAEFDDRWRRLPLRERAPLAALVPAYVAGMRLLGTRRFLARYMQLEDLPGDDEETELWTDDLVLHQRDRLLIDALTRLHHARAGRTEPFTAGILYGAAHMRAVTTALMDLGYRPAGSQWLTVFSLDDPGAA